MALSERHGKADRAKRADYEVDDWSEIGRLSSQRASRGGFCHAAEW
jgi:hypothetical protein